MKKRSIIVFVVLSASVLLSACTSMTDSTKKYNENTTVTYFSSQAKPLPAPVVVPLANLEVIVQGIIYFDFDKYNIKPEFNKVLEDHARILRENLSVVAKVEGHTDVMGSNDYNMPLGLLRAKEVRAALIQLGVQERQLEPVSLSFNQPAVDGLDADSRALNRRAEIAYQALR